MMPVGEDECLTVVLRDKPCFVFRAVAWAAKPGTITVVVDGLKENCPHLEGLRGVSAAGFWCPACEAWLDLEGVTRWVRAAEKARDESYPVVEGDKFGEIVREERQREVYRRRKVMYEVQNAARAPVRPEMVLVVYDGYESYRCRIFYKEPRSVSGVERLDIEADSEVIDGFRSHRDPVIRLVAEKVDEFHSLRSKLSEAGEHAPARRVFYAGDL